MRTPRRCSKSPVVSRNLKLLKILYLHKRPLLPADGGAKIRSLNVVRHLARWHNVTYLCNAAPGDEPSLEAMRQLGLDVHALPWDESPRYSWRFYLELLVNQFSRYPFSVAKDYDPKLASRAREMLETDKYDLVVCDFVQMALNVATLKQVPMVLFQHNVESQILERHARRSQQWSRRLLMRIQAGKMNRFEEAAGSWFERVVAVSSEDRRLFEQKFGWTHVHEIDTAVDLEYFDPESQAFTVEAATPDAPVFLYMGTMDWLPNVDAVQRFTQEAWPTIRARFPQAQFQIVGRHPAPAVKQLEQTAGVKVVGTVPDVRPYLLGCTCLVIPLDIGGGTRLKIFEAMAMGKAVISTPLGAEGLPVVDDEHICLAPLADFGQACVDLASDPARLERLGDSGRKLVTEQFGSETIARQFESICQLAIQSDHSYEMAHG